MKTNEFVNYDRFAHCQLLLLDDAQRMNIPFDFIYLFITKR